jgi:hypothetical protein
VEALRAPRAVTHENGCKNGDSSDVVTKGDRKYNNFEPIRSRGECVGNTVTIGHSVTRAHGHRLSDDEVERVKHYIAQGMSPKHARAEVLGEAN